MTKSQAQQILDYMQEFGSITQLDAFRDLGCMRLASRISDLRRRGYAIDAKLENVKNRYGQTVQIARYRLEG